MDYVLSLILIIITAIFVNNVVLAQFLGICPFLGVSKKVDTASGMGMAVTAVLVVATIVTYLIQVYVLNAFGLEYLQTIAFILVIAALVQMIEIILKKTMPALYQALGVFLPLITTNCCILGVILVSASVYDEKGEPMPQGFWFIDKDGNILSDIMIFGKDGNYNFVIPEMKTTDDVIKAFDGNGNQIQIAIKDYAFKP